MDRRPTWTDCDEAGDYAVPNVLSPRGLVFRPDNMEETVPHILQRHVIVIRNIKLSDQCDFYPLDSVTFLRISA